MNTPRAPFAIHPIRAGILVLFAIVAIAVSAGTMGCRRRPRARSTRPSLHISHARGPIVIDGEPDDLAWQDAQGALRTGPFVGVDGAPARPHSEARATWDETNLYLLLYAADEDIRTAHVPPDGPVWLDDAFHIDVEKDGTRYSIDVSPDGVITDGRRSSTATAFDYGWQSGARVARELDGTIDDPTDDDEEWILELSIPLSSLGLRPQTGERFGLSMHRCDVPKSGQRTCGSFGEHAPRPVVQLRP